MSLALDRRKRPPVVDQARILEEQDYRCLYCLRSFGSTIVTCGGRHVRLRVEWDHEVPFSYVQDNDPMNFAAACQRCNGWKAAKIFSSVEEIRLYVSFKWQALLGDNENDLIEIVPELLPGVSTPKD